MKERTAPKAISIRAQKSSLWTAVACRQIHPPIGRVELGRKNDFSVLAGYCDSGRGGAGQSREHQEQLEL
eukprot:CAMPEP_0206535724 /NCGR_PEP_ID=MMETSP0325_2-20121206/6318_1 /ASSEMBLY_ACC=CAM_ASM_000347 /TAXON_ID=2866 /ORGANISM="Crypthecodinium cohnii, Strain Seligo" /LENGTH=69 /DNA_ID=CAMNT_0054032787 /DNA_START=41 /DNA_END=247 /DNA_ORIENTATION=-